MDRFKMDYFIAMIPKVIKLLPATVKAALLSLLLSLLLGLVLAVVRQYKIKGLYALSSIYVSFFRGTPFIAQLFLFYYGNILMKELLYHILFYKLDYHHKEIYN